MGFWAHFWMNTTYTPYCPSSSLSLLCCAPFLELKPDFLALLYWNRLSVLPWNFPLTPFLEGALWIVITEKARRLQSLPVVLFAQIRTSGMGKITQVLLSCCVLLGHIMFSLQHRHYLQYILPPYLKFIYPAIHFSERGPPFPSKVIKGRGCWTSANSLHLLSIYPQK